MQANELDSDVPYMDPASIAKRFVTEAVATMHAQWLIDEAEFQADLAMLRRIEASGRAKAAWARRKAQEQSKVRPAELEAWEG